MVKYDGNNLIFNNVSKQAPGIYYFSEYFPCLNNLIVS